VKALRVIFLVFLALLLPIRGAVAGAMLCPQGSHSAVMDADHAGSAHHQHHEESSPAGHSAACGICATCCSMTPLLGAMPTVERSMLASTLSFPSFSVRVSAFQSDGQDRPPRSI
jgi:hypothetical protein